MKVNGLVKLPEEVLGLINDKASSKVLGTKSAKGDVHLIQVGGSGAVDPETLWVGEVFMKATGANLKLAQKDGTMVSMLVTKGFQSFEIRAKVKAHETSGPMFDKMREVFKSMKFELQGLWLLQPIEVYNESPTYDGGRKIL